MSIEALRSPRHHLPETARLAIEEVEQEQRLLALLRRRRRAQLHFASRWLVAAMFLAMGLDKLVHFKAEAETLFQLNIGGPEMALAITAVVELAGAALLWFGWGVRKVAIALSIYLGLLCLGVMVFFPIEVIRLYLLFNAGLLGGLMMLASHGAGPFSVDARLEAKWAREAALEEHHEIEPARPSIH
ncbi:MAG: DoxX family protein [Myxococcaceae bacterium]